jgi:hypothetical protein
LRGAMLLASAQLTRQLARDDAGSAAAALAPFWAKLPRESRMTSGADVVWGPAVMDGKGWAPRPGAGEEWWSRGGNTRAPPQRRGQLEDRRGAPGNRPRFGSRHASATEDGRRRLRARTFHPGDGERRSFPGMKRRWRRVYRFRDDSTSTMNELLLLDHDASPVTATRYTGVLCTPYVLGRAHVSRIAANRPFFFLVQL